MSPTGPRKPSQSIDTGLAVRTGGLRNPLDKWLYHPLAHRVAMLLAKSAITPNAVSVAGGICIALAGIIYVQTNVVGGAFLGLVMHMSWHVLDGADGDLARLTGRVTPKGEVIDGVCDYSGHIVLYLLLAGAAYTAFGWAAWALAIGAGASRIVQANFYEVQRRRYLYWAYDVPWVGTREGRIEDGILSSAGAAYLRVARLLMPAQVELDAAAEDPDRRRDLSRLVRAKGPSAIMGSSFLGANYRTLALGASMIAGSPLWYFAYEILVLNIVLLNELFRTRRNLAELSSAVHDACNTLL